MTNTRILKTMEVHGKEIEGECSECGNVLQCELFLDGYGIQRERKNVAKMMPCRFEHRKKREEHEH